MRGLLCAAASSSLPSISSLFVYNERSLDRCSILLLAARIERANANPIVSLAFSSSFLFFLLPFLLIRGRISFSSARLLHGEGEGRNEKRNMGRLRATCNRVTANPR